MNWYLDVLKKYAEFSGRARRKEYWMFLLIHIVIAIAIVVIEGMLGSPLIVYTIYMLALLVPSLAVTVRRLHDISKSGWWVLISLVPFVGGIILLVFMALDSTPGDNAHGPNPKEAPAVPAEPVEPPPPPAQA